MAAVEVASTAADKKVKKATPKKAKPAAKKPKGEPLHPTYLQVFLVSYDRLML